MDIASKIYVAGHCGMVGSAVVRCLQAAGYRNLVLRERNELDLTCQLHVRQFFEAERPEYVFVAAAKVGGILANRTYRADFIYQNLEIQNNLFHMAWRTAVKKLFFFSSSCVYPRLCPQPMQEDFLWTGPVEPTNEPYAVAKLAGMSMCRAYNDQYGTRFVCGIPPNLFGRNDHYDPDNSHVVAALIHKLHAAKYSRQERVQLWGTGSPRRELMFVDDAAHAALFLMMRYKGNDPINIGVGYDFSIKELSDRIKAVVGYEGTIDFDPTKPDGAPRKCLDIKRLSQLGWSQGRSLDDTLAETYSWYLHDHVHN
jgi:GDP-L-fucose synthase